MSIRQKMIMMMECTKLHKHFQEYFRVVPALTPELAEEAYRIRHQVYCEDLNWEPVRENGMETDTYDAQSLHCLLQSVQTNEFIGCVRLVLPDHNNPMQPLPFQQACHETLDPGIPNPQLQAASKIAEISRLAVIKKYRRRPLEQTKAVRISDKDFGSIRQPRFPYIPVGLYLGVMEMAKRADIDKLYFLTEPSLAGHFTRMGGKLRPIGGAIEHRGKRAPYELDVKEVTGKINLMLRPLNKLIVREIDQAYQLEHQFSRQSA